MRVLMYGPGLEVHGGVSTVERLIVDHIPADYEFEFHSKLRDTTRIARLLPW